jgi:uncharacterized protein YceK
MKQLLFLLPILLLGCGTIFVVDGPDATVNGSADASVVDCSK